MFSPKKNAFVLLKSGAAALLLGTLMTTPVSAVPVRINFSAIVTNPFGTLSANEVISGNFVMDTASATVVPVDPNGTEYFGFVSSETIGNSTVLNPVDSVGLIANDRASWAPYDVAGLIIDYQSGSGLSLGGYTDISTNFQFWGPTTMFSDEGLSELANLPFPAVNSNIITFYESQTTGSLLGFGQITSWEASAVPDEGLTGGMLGLTFVGLLALRRKMSRAGGSGRRC